MKDESEVKLWRSAYRALNTLIERALAGNELAATMLHNLSHRSVRGFLHVAKKRPEVLRPSTRNAVTIPAFISPNAQFVQKPSEIMECLHVGSNIGLKPGKKNWSLETGATKYAMEIYKLITEERIAGGGDDDIAKVCAALKDFNTRSVRRWFAVGRKFHLDKIPNLEDRDEWKSVTRYHPKPKSRRAYIYQKIEEALIRMASSSSSPEADRRR